MPLPLLVLITAALLVGCSPSTPLCEEGDNLIAAAQPARALEVYARARTQGDRCAEEGLETASTNLQRAARAAAHGEAAERMGDVAAAANAYQAALALDVTNTLAVTGLARIGQPAPVPPPPAAAPPPDPSSGASPWPYFLGSVLFSVLLAGAVMWFVRTRLSILETVADELKKRLDDMQRRLQSNEGRLDNPESGIRSDQARIDALEQNSTAHKQAAARDRDRLDRTRAELERALRREKERVDHLTELLDVLAQTQPAPTSETVLWFERQPVEAAPADEDAPDDERAHGTEDGAGVDEPMSVEVNVYEIRIADGWMGRERLVVQRIVGPVSERGDSGSPSPPPGDNERPREREPGAGERALAGRVVEPVWERVESWWVTPDYRGPADAAQLVKDVQTRWHDLVLGKPAERVALEAGLPLAFVELSGDIAAKVPLLGDVTLKGVRRLLQFTGIVLGAVSGAPLLANACVKSLAHDLLAEAMARAFCKAINSMLTPTRRETRPLAPDELGPAGAHACQLHRNLAEFLAPKDSEPGPSPDPESDRALDGEDVVQSVAVALCRGWDQFDKDGPRPATENLGEDTHAAPPAEDPPENPSNDELGLNAPPSDGSPDKSLKDNPGLFGNPGWDGHDSREGPVR